VRTSDHTAVVRGGVALQAAGWLAGRSAGPRARPAAATAPRPASLHSLCAHFRTQHSYKYLLEIRKIRSSPSCSHTLPHESLARVRNSPNYSRIIRGVLKNHDCHGEDKAMT
jgi:hypothetical protein